MAIEDDVAALQTQVVGLQNSISNLQSSVNSINSSISGLQTSINSINSSISGLQTSINSINTSLDSKASIAYVDEKFDEISGSNTVPLPPAEIQGGEYDSNGNYIDYYSDGVIGTSLPYSRSDHKHPGDITRAPINNPVFDGIPRSNYTPEKGSAEYEGNCIANTRFVLQAIKDYTTTPPVSVTPPSGEGELPQAEIPGQPGGNSENTNIGGGGIGGRRGNGGRTDGGNGTRGTDGVKGDYTIIGTEYEDNYNWNIATYVHT